MKKFLLIVAFLVCMLTINEKSYASIGQKIECNDNAYFYATKVLTEYYQAIDQYKEYDFSDDISSLSLLDYINKKVEAKRYKREVYGDNDMQNYNVNFKLINIDEIDNNFILTIVANIEFVYKDADFTSGYSEEIHLLLSRSFNKYKIVDWNLPYDDYDTIVRDETQDISTLNSWNNILRINSDVQEKQEILNTKIKQYYDDLEKEINSIDTENHNYINTISVHDELTDITPYSTLYSLNKSNMVTWANNNCAKANPSSGNSNKAPYYDFSQISGNYDCTNFVSHAILAGGSVLYNTGNTGISSTGWYYKNLNNRSSSWSGVANLYSFLTSNTTSINDFY